MITHLVLVLMVLVNECCAYYKYTNADYLDSLDYIICAQIKDPAQNYCDKLYEHLDQYCEGLHSMIVGVRAQDTTKAEAIASYWSLGKPKFLQTFDIMTLKMLETELEIIKFDIKEFYKKLQMAEALWEEFKAECELNKHICMP